MKKHKTDTMAKMFDYNKIEGFPYEERHKNILKFGTITNTLMRACEVNGEMINKVKP